MFEWFWKCAIYQKRAIGPVLSLLVIGIGEVCFYLGCCFNN